MFYFFSSITTFLISIVITLIINRNYSYLKSSNNFIVIFTSIWIFLYLFHFFILGNYSAISFYDNADIGLSRILYEKYHHLGGRFLHSILGGQDYFTTQGFLNGFISLEKLIFNFFPVWLGLLIHKTLIVFIGFFGCLILFNKAYNFEKIDSIFVSALFTVYNLYTVTSTIHHGLGYSLIPSTIYIFLYCTHQRYYFLKIFLISLLTVISTSPLHSFMGVMGGIIVSFFLKKPISIKKYIFAIIILLFLYLLNWHEGFYSIYDEKNNLSRILTEKSTLNIFGSIGYLFKKTDLYFLYPSWQYSPIVIISFVTFFLLIFKSRYQNLFLLLFFNYIPNIVVLLVNLLGLDFLKSLNFYNYSYVIYIPILFYLLMVLNEIKNETLTKSISIFLFFVSLLYMFSHKFNYTKKIFFENQSYVTQISNLKKRDWEKKELFRTVTTNPYSSYHPNFNWIYGIDTIDGYINLIDINFAKFWIHGVKKEKINELKFKKNFYSGDFYINKKPILNNYNLDKIVDLNLLKLVNTGYLISHVPIKSNSLKIISEDLLNKFILPKNLTTERNMNFYLKTINNQYKNIFNSSSILIYEIKDSSHRFYFPVKSKILKNDLKIFEKYRFISKEYEKNIIFSEDKSISLSNGSNIKEKKIINGYNVDLEVKKKGIFVFNQFYSKFWRVFINGKEKKVLNINDLQMGVTVNKSTKNIKFIYDRPKLFEKLFLR